MQTQTATKSLRLSVRFDPLLSPQWDECNVSLQLGILDIKDARPWQNNPKKLTT